MSTTWKSGDRAVCVSQFRREGRYGETPEEYGITLPTVNMVYLIDGTLLTSTIHLHLAGYPEFVYFCSTRFRKVVPRCDRADSPNTDILSHET